MNIRPIKDRILVKQDPPKEKLGSLFVPQGTRDLYEDIGTVLAVGPGRVTEGGVLVPVSVSVGDRIYFKRRPSSDLSGFDESLKDHLMLYDEDVIGLVL